MDKLMQAIFDHIMGTLFEAYCTQTEYAEQVRERESIGHRLREQLDGEQRELLEKFQWACNSTHVAELEAMFLASFDTVSALSRRHIA